MAESEEVILPKWVMYIMLLYRAEVLQRCVHPYMRNEDVTPLGIRAGGIITR